MNSEMFVLDGEACDTARLEHAMDLSDNLTCSRTRKIIDG